MNVNRAYFYTAVPRYKLWHLFDLSCPLRCEGAATYTDSEFLDGHSSTPTSTAAFYKVLQFIHPCCLLPHALTSCRRCCCWQNPTHSHTHTRKPTERARVRGIRSSVERPSTAGRAAPSQSECTSLPALWRPAAFCIITRWVNHCEWC